MDPTKAQAANGAAVSYVLTRLESQFNRLGLADPMRGMLSFGSLKVILNTPPVFAPLSAWALMPLPQAIESAMRDIRVHPEPLVLCFANTSWRLLIASRVVALPEFGSGGTFGAITGEGNLAMLARLHAQPFGKSEPDPNALRAWQTVITASDDAALKTFITTALAYSLPISILPPNGGINECEDDYVDQLPEEDV